MYILNDKKNTETILTFDFSTLYIIILQNLLIKVLIEIISFFLNYKSKTRVGFSESSVYWTSEGAEK